MSIPGIHSAGRLESLHLAHLLARCWAGGFSGSFRAQGGSGPAPAARKEILFERGRIAWAASDDARESIRTYLLNRGLLRAEQWKLAQERAGSATPRQTLLDLGFLSARELQDADRERVSGIVLSLFNWADGEYATSAAPLPPGTPNLKIDPRDLVLEGIMSSGDRERVLRELGSLDSVLVVRPDDLVRASLSLPVELVELMGRADGTRTVAEICALSPLSDFMISAAFAALKILSLATPAEGSTAAAPPAPPRAAAGAPARRRPSHPGAHPALNGSPLPLPLGEDPPAEESATTRVISTPPRGTAVEPPEEDDSGTIPMEATPPGGTPLRPPGEVIAGPDDPGTQPMTATPPGGQPAVNEWNEHREKRTSSDEKPGEPREREGETELTPGIPLGPAAPEPEGRDGLGDDEIESAVRMFGGPEGEEPPAPAGSAPEHREERGPELPPETVSDPPDLQRREPPRKAAPDLREEQGWEPPHETATDPREGEEEEPPREARPGAVEEPAGEQEVDTAMEDAPTWIYEPSGPVPPGSRSRRWATWGGMVAAIFAVGTVLTLILGGGDEAPPARSTASSAGEARQGPPAVEVPEAPADSGGASGPGAAGAGEKEGPPPPDPPSPPRRQVAVATQETPPARLASSGGGSILGSASYVDAREDLEAGRLAEAARGFQSTVSDKSGLYTVQLALACRRETVTRALKSIGGAQEFFILPKEFNGRACYRLLWGAYPGRSAAESGRSSVPRAFLQAKDKPFVAPI